MTIYAVNGKEPVAAWIPSLDDSGNGTTTLTDLVGANHGTLTNMDPATDWVADTDAGGVRALNFDGVNDYIDISTGSIPAELKMGAGDFTVAAWFKDTASLGSNNRIFCCGTNGGKRYELLVGQNNWFRGVLDDGAVKTDVESAGITVRDGAWHSGVFVRNAATGTVQVYVDSILYKDMVYSSGDTDEDTSVHIGRLTDLGFTWQGSLDDIRIWDQALDAADIAYLYKSGNGRGVTPTTPNTRRRRYAGGYGL